ncbi:unnamed protein product [Scytosiphon promiscuus]
MAGWNGVVSAIMALFSFIAAGATFRGAVHSPEVA